MDWLTKIIEVIKVPLKILLPAIWLFSGIMTLLPDAILKKFSLLEWRNDNGFVFGLMFIISTCFILVYAFYYAKDKILDLFHRLTRNRRYMKRISNLNITEQAILFKMYHSPGYTMTLDYGQPITQGLLARSFIYGGGQQLLSLNYYTNSLEAKFTLQPFVYQTLDYYKTVLSKKIERLTSKAAKAKNEKRKAKLQKKRAEYQDVYDAIYNGGY